MKPKIALCLVGGNNHNPPHRPTERTDFELCYKFNKKYIFDANSQYDFDIYIHHWNNFNPGTDELLKKLYNPIDIISESNEPLSTKYNSTDFPYIYRARGYLGFHDFSVKTSQKRCIELVEKSGISYDYVIIYRADCLLWTPLIIDSHDKNIIWTDGHNCDNGAQYGETIFIMNLENAKQLKNLPDKADIYAPDGHYWMKPYVTEYMNKELRRNYLIPGPDKHFEMFHKIPLHNLYLIINNNRELL
jgi:hypothetical protein